MKCECDIPKDFLSDRKIPARPNVVKSKGQRRVKQIFLI